MVAVDGGGLLALGGSGLDSIGVNRALVQKRGVGELAGFLFENGDELGTYDFAFGFGGR